MMIKSKAEPRQERTLILMPTGRDAALTQRVLADAGICSFVCEDMEVVSREIEVGVGAILITEEALDKRAISRLLRAIEDQPAWSDIPIILFATSTHSTSTLLRSLGERANVIILERPINIGVVTGTVRAALRARRRQYEAERLLKELEAADQQKDLFLATISHELRTPLNAILGWTSILCNSQPDEQTAARALQTIERNARAQGQLIDDILDISRITRGKLRIEYIPVKLPYIIYAAIDVLRPAAQAKRIVIEPMLSSEDITVTGDPGRLQQVIWNLLTNAIKFSSDGGHIQVTLGYKDGYAEISVRDNGKGIEAEFLPYIFDYFRQADNTITRTHGGLGLGLAIVYRLVEVHGGTVEATSEGTGKGATFTVKLPLQSEQRAEDLTESATKKETNAFDIEETAFPTENLQDVKILVVDDTEDARDLVAHILELCGATVTTASSAAEALALLGQRRFDALISDIEMPAQDGYSLIKQWRQQETHNGTRLPAAALTAHARATDRAQALAAGFDTHIAKPVEAGELTSVIARLIKRNGHWNPGAEDDQFMPRNSPLAAS